MNLNQDATNAAEQKEEVAVENNSKTEEKEPVKVAAKKETKTAEQK